MKNKRGIAFSFLAWLILGLIVVVLMFVFYASSQGGLDNLFSAIKNLLRFGR